MAFGTLRHPSLSAGANAKAVQKMLGHASAAMTLEVYADLFDDDLDAVGGGLVPQVLRKLWAKRGHGAILSRIR